MAYYEKEYKQRLLTGQGNNALITLISVNLILFILLAFVKAILHLSSQDANEVKTLFNSSVLSWFTLSADVSQVGSRPWTILTHMFVHDGVWSVFANMLWLWMFGYIMTDLTGNRKIFPVYLYGALAGGLVFVLTSNLLPALRPQISSQFTLGASAGVMAIAVAVTSISPTYKIFPMLKGGIPIWIITLIYVVIDLVSIPSNDTAEHASHFAGAITGYLFMYFYKMGYDWGAWINNFFDWFTNLFNPDKPKKGSNLKEELFYKATTVPFKKTPNVTEQRVDEILDKISQKGYNSLTEEEKDLLKRASQR
jgi:membrane associated rhomboid family serine protease